MIFRRTGSRSWTKDQGRLLALLRNQDAKRRNEELLLFIKMESVPFFAAVKCGSPLTVQDHEPVIRQDPAQIVTKIKSG
ncbi:hypothetical protein V511_13155 [Mesotoga sp. Brook.08.YT.4.2.5.1]|nr:hypothetical protein V511_13155 [Mesotoga sp. Brook.08.YT.4.2.5.1]PVD17047.1 hypothetical protein V512_008960 [Mesotoga sp. Brook.08.105.5.1]RAO95425.1 hypothetical protein M388_06860 [Mesotoga sp. Brook.08.YT.4.2.5.4.]RDI93414.1 hypothetical protein Q502_05850 [Mesotoga sp. Brook.08.YT.4.2.5.2.]